jgi:hypothetical protein
MYHLRNTIVLCIAGTFCSGCWLKYLSPIDPGDPRASILTITHAPTTLTIGTADSITFNAFAPRRPVTWRALSRTARVALLDSMGGPLQDSTFSAVVRLQGAAVGIDTVWVDLLYNGGVDTRKEVAVEVK